MNDLLFMLQEEPAIATFVAVVFGLLVGSFLNVVICRLPVIMKGQWYANIKEILDDAVVSKEKTGIEMVDNGTYQATPDAPLAAKPYRYLAWPPSACPNCNHKIKSYENIPVLSWLFLRGKCKGCHTPISIQYPIVEALTGILVGLVVWLYGVNLEAGLFIVLLLGLITATFIDLKHYLLPDEIMLPLLWLGLVASFAGWVSMPFEVSFLGAVVGYLFFWIVNFVYKTLFRKEGMGHGDFKLLALLGAWLGVNAILPIILISTIVGSIVGISLMLFFRHERSKPIPFGPYLALAGVIYLLFGASFIHQWVPPLWLT